MTKNLWRNMSQVIFLHGELHKDWLVDKQESAHKYIESLHMLELMMTFDET